MPRYKLTVAYEGTDFCGWQKQTRPVRPGDDPSLPVGDDGRIHLRTVQEELERAVREVVREPVQVKGSSRTDSGVHARGQVAAFTCSGDAAEDAGDVAGTEPGATDPDAPDPADRPSGAGWPVARGTDRLVRAINSRLPEDALVLDAAVVDPAFDPVSDCVSKGYSYTLHVARNRPLWARRHVLHVWIPLDVGRMRQAAAMIEGEHDFAAFAAAGHGRKSTVRRVDACVVHEAGGTGFEAGGDRVRIEVSGNGFLYNMVRIITGTLIDVGRGRLDPEDIPRIIEGRDRRAAGPTVPPWGLCLEWIRFGTRSQSLTTENTESTEAEA